MKLHTILTLSLLGVAGTLQAASITDWQDLGTSTGGITSGANTDSPIYGDGVTEGSANNAFIAGSFGSTASLAVGQTLTVTGGLALTGGANSNIQIRFGVFNDGGQIALGDFNNWTGGWLYSIGNGGSSSTLVQGRTDGAYISSFGNAVDLGASAVTTGTFNDDSPADPYTFSFSVTRDSATTVDVEASISGGVGTFDETITANDITTTLFDYTSFGGLFGGGAGLEQGAFTGVEFNVIPEPSSALLLGLGGIALLRRRR